MALITIVRRHLRVDAVSADLTHGRNVLSAMRGCTLKEERAVGTRITSAMTSKLLSLRYVAYCSDFVRDTCLVKWRNLNEKLFRNSIPYFWYTNCNFMNNISALIKQI